MTKSNYTISDIYQGGPSTFSPKYGNLFTGYGVSAGSFGMGTDARTANVLKEASSKLNMGIKTVELSQVSPEVFEAIPKGQLKEVKRVAKLTGTDVTLHAPVVEASGVGQQGLDESQRKAAERQMKLAMERAHELNPKGNSPVTFHSSAGIPSSVRKPGKEGKEYEKLIAINIESGKMTPLEEEFLHYPGEMKEPIEVGWKRTPESRLKNINVTEWDNSITQLIFNKERADEILQKNEIQIAHVLDEIQKATQQGIKPKLSPDQQQAYSHYVNAANYLKDTHQHINNLFHKAYKYGTREAKEKLNKLSEQFKEDLKKNKSMSGQSQAMQNLLVELKDTDKIIPQMYVPVDEFAIDKSSETFANVAMDAYKKFGDEASVVSIENPPAGGAISTGEDLRNLIEKTREKFIQGIMKPESEGGKSLSKSQAEREAERMIGATWDVGHINMLRKQGFDEKQIIEESKQIAPLVKHVHLSDNFGFEHTELPMGMGNVPVKEIMEKLGKKGFKAKKVIEAINWWQHFSPQGSPQVPPFQPSLEAFGSPMFAGDSAYQWNQSLGFYQGYSGGLGEILPQGNFQTFGVGFSQLPVDLGGQRFQGQGSRVSGRPME